MERVNGSAGGWAESASWPVSALQPGPVSLFPPPPQYMMLSGQVPFQGASGQGGQSQAAEIMCKIREGRFSLDGEAWQGVSEEAKELVRGAEPPVGVGAGSQIMAGEAAAVGSRWVKCLVWGTGTGGEWGSWEVSGA